MSRRTDKTQKIQSLRKALARHEAGFAERPVVRLGAPEADARLTGGGLSLSGLHEVVGASYPDMGAASGFAAGLAARLMDGGARELVWVSRSVGPHDMGALYGPGLAALGLDPARLILVAARSDREALWVTEEAIGAAGLAGVVTELAGQGRDYDLTASRRLQLAAEKAGRPAVLIAGHAGEVLPPPSAALTRFRVSAAPGGEGIGHLRALGAPRYRVHLDRVRGGGPAEFILEWNHAACRFGVAAPFRGGAVCPSQPFGSSAAAGPADPAPADAGTVARAG